MGLSVPMAMGILMTVPMAMNVRLYTILAGAIFLKILEKVLGNIRLVRKNVAPNRVAVGE